MVNPFRWLPKVIILLTNGLRVAVSLGESVQNFLVLRDGSNTYVLGRVSSHEAITLLICSFGADCLPYRSARMLSKLSQFYMLSGFGEGAYYSNYAASGICMRV